jgi:hypothetical protein
MKLVDRKPASVRTVYRLAACLALATGVAFLTPDARAQDNAGRAAVGQAEQQRAPRRQEPAPAGPRIAEVAGRYAVLREDGKDTLCMVTLQDAARGNGYFRAQLAPACRDNGIVVFDPVAWSIDRAGHISLQARKGHKIQFQRNAKGEWLRIDDKAKPLGLRRI